MRRLLFAVIMLVASSSLAMAGVFWEDNFENHLAPNWDTASCSNGTQAGPQDGCYPMIIDTVWAHAGTHSLHSIYNCTAGLTTGDGSCGPYYNRLHTPTTNVYMRWWMRMVNWTVNPIAGSKILYNETNQKAGTSSIIWHQFQNSHELSIQSYPGSAFFCPGTGLTEPVCNWYPNVGHVRIDDGALHCIETHANINNGGSTGTLEAWVDGVQVHSHINVPVGSVGDAYDMISRYNQLGQGDIFIDDYAVGNTRIGCGPISADTTTPAAPTGLSVR